MSSKTRKQQKNSGTKSNVLKNYEECLKQGISLGKTYGSDFLDGFIVKRYIHPPYPWNIEFSSTDKKKIDKQNKSQKSITTVKKKIKIKSKSVQRSKSIKKKTQRSKTRKR